jgi:hypothetical protein
LTGAGGTTAPRLRAALSGSSILPSDTAVRYASLLGMVFATTAEIYTRLWLDRASHAGTYQACWADWMRLGPLGWLSGSAPQLFGQSVGCAKPYAPTALAYALAGVAAVGAFAAVGYLAMPWWRIKRRNLQPLDRVRSTVVFSALIAVVAARTRHVGATYAVQAAFVSISVFAIIAPRARSCASPEAPRAPAHPETVATPARGLLHVLYSDEKADGDATDTVAAHGSLDRQRSIRCQIDG